MGTKEPVPEFHLVFAKTAMQLVSREARNEVENIVRLISDDNSDAGDLCRQVRRVDDCKRVFDNRGDKKLA